MTTNSKYNKYYFTYIAEPGWIYRDSDDDLFVFLGWDDRHETFVFGLCVDFFDPSRWFYKFGELEIIDRIRSIQMFKDKVEVRRIDYSFTPETFDEAQELAIAHYEQANKSSDKRAYPDNETTLEGTQSQSTFGYLLTNNGITIILEGKHHVISSDNSKYNLIINAVKTQDLEKLKDLLDVSGKIEKETEGNVTVQNGIVMYQGNPIHNSLTERIVRTIDLGLDAKPFMKFMDHLQNNPSYRSREQLFDFLDACDLPILPDGRFLAYKSVNKDYWDTHTGKTYKNTVGSIVEMDRNLVDDNQDRTCSAGLHVCSQKYGMYGAKLMHVAVDPKDVVSVPKEYNMAKMRVCRYEVLEEAPENSFKQWDDSPVYEWGLKFTDRETFSEYQFGYDELIKDFLDDDYEDWEF